jgi:hypothetical protein
VGVVKHPDGYGFPRKRVMWLTMDLSELRIFTRRVQDEKTSPSLHAKITCVKLADITEVRRGRSPDGLLRAGKDRRCFCIVSKVRTLVLEASNEQIAELIASRLALLAIDQQQNRQWMQRHYGDGPAGPGDTIL